MTKTVTSLALALSALLLLLVGALEARESHQSRQACAARVALVGAAASEWPSGFL